MADIVHARDDLSAKGQESSATKPARLVDDRPAKRAAADRHRHPRAPLGDRDRVPGQPVHRHPDRRRRAERTGLALAQSDPAAGRDLDLALPRRPDPLLLRRRLPRLCAPLRPREPQRAEEDARDGDAGRQQDALRRPQRAPPLGGLPDRRHHDGDRHLPLSRLGRMADLGPLLCGLHRSRLHLRPHHRALPVRRMVADLPRLPAGRAGADRSREAEAAADRDRRRRRRHRGNCSHRLGDARHAGRHQGRRRTEARRHSRRGDVEQGASCSHPYAARREFRRPRQVDRRSPRSAQRREGVPRGEME